MTEPDRPRDRSGAWSSSPNSAAWDWATSEPGYTGKPRMPLSRGHAEDGMYYVHRHPGCPWDCSAPPYVPVLPEVTPRPEPDSVTLAAAVKAQTQAIRELTKAIRTLALAVATEPDDE